MALIGISGKIGSGKDTIGKIIQYLTVSDYENVKHILKERNNKEISIEEHFNSFIERDYKVQWEIKKFADKLKDITCLILGCNREQLEDREFKEKELGEEWNKYLLKEYWVNDEYAEYTTNVYFNTEKEMEKYCVKMNHTDNTCSQVSTIQKMTPRLLLQLLGTECGRNIIHPNIWVNALFAEYIPETTWDSNKWNKPISNWIITDMRFPNELQAVKNKRGITIRVNRYKGEMFMSGTGNQETIQITKEHPSETALDNAEFDYVIDNNGIIEKLIEKIREILIKEKII